MREAPLIVPTHADVDADAAGEPGLAGRVVAASVGVGWENTKPGWAEAPELGASDVPPAPDVAVARGPRGPPQADATIATSASARRGRRRWSTGSLWLRR